MENVYFMCPGPVESTIETMNTMELRFHCIVTGTTRRCLDIARDVYDGVPSQFPPFVSDLLLPQGFGRVREPCSVLKKDYPTIDFSEYFEESMWLPEVPESNEQLIERVDALMRVVNRMEGTVLVIAPVDLIRTYTGVSLTPGGFFRQDQKEDLGNWRSFMSTTSRTSSV
jgi:hypothetical protein